MTLNEFIEYLQKDAGQFGHFQVVDAHGNLIVRTTFDEEYNHVVLRDE